MSTRRDAPFISVKVGAPDAEKERVNVDAARIMSLSYEDKERGADTCVLEVDNFDLQHIDSPIFRKGNLLEVSWGYEGRPAPVREVEITKVTGSLVLKVEARDQGMQFGRVVKTRHFENMKRSDVAKDIAKEQGFGPDFPFVQDTQETLEQITQARLTDAQLLSDMAAREGFEWFVDFDGFHFHERAIAQKPMRSFVYYTSPGNGDILKWNIKNDITVNKPGKIRLVGRDPITKETIDVVADNSEVSERATLGAVAEIVSPDDAKNEGDANTKNTASEWVIPTTELNAASAERMAKGLFRQVQLEAVELELQCIGDPFMVAKSVISVERIGPTISGLYYVTSVKHNVKSGYTMTMMCKSDGKAAAVNTATAYDDLPGQSNKGVPAGGKQNKKEAPDKVEEVDPYDAGGGLSYHEVTDEQTGQTVPGYKDTSGRVYYWDSSGKLVEVNN